MGYYTDYNLEIQAGKMHDAGLMNNIKDALLEISGYTGWYYGHDELKLNEAKWYDYYRDMQKLSERYPDLKFELHCRGEDGDQWIVYALGGKVEQCESHVEFAPRTLW